MVGSVSGVVLRLRRSRWYLALIPALTAVFVALPGITQGGFHTDSHVYLAVVLRMLESGDWLHLWQGNLPYHNKPPLGFWLVAPFVRAFGPEVWAVRAPMVLVSAACASAVYLMFREVVRTRVALTAAVVFALTHEVFRFTHAFSLDLVMLLCMVLSAWCVTRAAGVRVGRSRGGRLVALGGVPMGLALMTKPFVPLLLVAILAAWLWSVGRRGLVAWLGALVCVAAAVAAPWHAEMMRAYPAGSATPFLETYLFSQSIDRLGGGGHVTEPVWYYAWELAQSYVPWIVPLAGGLVWIGVRRRPLTGRWAGDGLALLWAGVWIGVMTLSAGKSMRYLVPVYPALALIAGAALVRMPPRGRLTPLVFPWLVLAVSVGLMASGVRIHDEDPPERAELYAFLDAYSGGSTEGWPALWIAPDMLWRGAYVAVERGVYPGVAVSPEYPAGGAPAAGDLMLFRLSESGGPGRYVPREEDAVLARFDDWAVARLGSAWGGAYRTRE